MYFIIYRLYFNVIFKPVNQDSLNNVRYSFNVLFLGSIFFIIPTFSIQLILKELNYVEILALACV